MRKIPKYEENGVPNDQEAAVVIPLVAAFALAISLSINYGVDRVGDYLGSKPSPDAATVVQSIDQGTLSAEMQ